MHERPSLSSFLSPTSDQTLKLWNTIRDSDTLMDMRPCPSTKTKTEVDKGHFSHLSFYPYKNAYIALMYNSNDLLLRVVKWEIVYMKMPQIIYFKVKPSQLFFQSRLGAAVLSSVSSFRPGKYSGLGSALMCPLRMIAFRKGALVYWTQGFIWSSQAAQIV